MPHDASRQAFHLDVCTELLDLLQLVVLCREQSNEKWILIMPAHLVWVICASVRWLLVLAAWASVPDKDVYSYFAFARALREQASADPTKQCEDAVRPSLNER